MNNHFGIHVFGLDKMQKALPQNIFRKFKKTVDEKKNLDPAVADAIAMEIKKWALSMGVTHYTHWFMPLTGLTAGKQNTFLDRDDNGTIISEFSGRELIKGEPDASSFPHGGMRSTFEARGYTAWDPTSPVFISRREKGCILFIPSVFFGYNGEVLDKKTPLLRSLKLINGISVNLLKKFNQRAGWVKNMVGPEQEFFLVRRRDFLCRPDLKTLGRVLFASRPARGQQMGDHYFGAIPEKVLCFLEEVEEEAYKLGVPIKTRHNEVAPNQFEIAPIYDEANVAADHNQLLMDLLRDTARKHDMVCLLHEKPVRFFNGSGKHLNWSLVDSNHRNLFTPGNSKSTRFVFLSFLTGFIVGLNRHNDLIQSVLASPGNDLRLGGHEAPPSIVSVYLGEELQWILKNLEPFISGKLKKAPMIRVEQFVPPILHDMTDRNRTSPVAFTGNKFEFRMPGSSSSLAFPNAVINLAVSHGLDEVYQAIEPMREDQQILDALGGLIREHSGVVFEGDNYDEKWHREAKKRKLFIPTSLPHTIGRLREEKNIALFEQYNILARHEIEAREAIKIEIFVKTVEMELRVARYMIRAYVIPTALKYQKILLDAVEDFPKAVLEEDPGILDKQLQFIKKFTRRINEAMEILSRLDEDNERLKVGDPRQQADMCASEIRPRLAEAGELMEKIEARVDQQLWQMPMIPDILFR